jgi:hypothetical protein
MMRLNKDAKNVVKPDTYQMHGQLPQGLVASCPPTSGTIILALFSLGINFPTKSYKALTPEHSFAAFKPPTE